jgi:hypothetical protein
VKTSAHAESNSSSPHSHTESDRTFSTLPSLVNISWTSFLPWASLNHWIPNHLTILFSYGSWKLQKISQPPESSIISHAIGSFLKSHLCFMIIRFLSFTSHINSIVSELLIVRFIESTTETIWKKNPFFSIR